jgi:hypothetical protein
LEAFLKTDGNDVAWLVGGIVVVNIFTQVNTVVVVLKKIKKLATQSLAGGLIQLQRP